MAKLPRPPSIETLRAPEVGCDVVTFPASTRLVRVYFRAGRHPSRWNRFRHFGPTAARLDHHVPDASGAGRMQDPGILYAAGGHDAAGLVCLAEVFQKRRLINRARGVPWMVAFDTLRPLRLLDLTLLWPTRAGASTAIASGPRPRAREWSRCIYEAYPEIDGLWYPSSMAGHAPAMALYERAAVALPAAPRGHRSLDDPVIDGLLEDAAIRLNYRLD